LNIIDKRRVRSLLIEELFVVVETHCSDSFLVFGMVICVSGQSVECAL
jgi:hypothetical protein